MKAVQAFTTLSPRVRAYLAVWYALGACAVVYFILHCHEVNWHVLGYVAASLALNVKTVRGAQKSSTSSASFSLSSAAAFAAIIGVGPVAGIPVEACSTVFDSFFPKRRPLYQALFNISICSVSSLAAGFVYRGLVGFQFSFWTGDPVIRMGQAAGPMVVASFVYFVINTVGVAEVVALVSETSLRNVWHRSFQTSFVGYTTGGACAVLVLGLYSAHMWLPSLALLAIPILYACYSREQSDEARVVALEKGKERLEGLYLASIRTLALTVAARDRYTSGHIHRVTGYAVAIARKLGCTDEEITDIQTGALLHDIGKIGVPEHILTKPGKLTPEEMDAMRQHAAIGWTILAPLNFPDVVKQIVRNHHEWYNGTGYPDALTGDAIPMLVRIVSVSDVFDALTTDRPYRAALSLDESRDIMRRNAGSQFDPTVLAAFFEILDTVPLDELRAVASDSPVLTDFLKPKPELSPLPDTLHVPVAVLTLSRS